MAKAPIYRAKQLKSGVFIVSNPASGVTIVARREPSVMQIATAVCSGSDVFKYKEGKALAIGRLDRGQYVILPVPEQGNELALLDDITAY